MTETYAEYSDICTKFYDLVVDPVQVAEFVYSKIKQYYPRKCLFVGGFFSVARELQKTNLELVVTDYTDEMVKEAQKRLPNTRIERADLRHLPFENEFDTILVIGRVFTHMLTADDASQALQSIHRALKPEGLVLLDNYEDSKIQVTDYFNGLVSVSDSSIEIIRRSTTKLVSQDPFVVNWFADYRVTSQGNLITFSDQMRHRAFSRSEMKNLFEENGFSVCAQGDNFDETSFFTLARTTKEE